ncbi:hypothetical protein [Pseudarthrobacter sp. fls2-241-R2A-168]|uniref:hypothetical protein n=1 Tax=Pseudarthrobacter sp. fls2-241-R2A-168 TaxID=3040304 RepID=UPI0025566593|nr:hypothetical protein [Pseudarthrobacter sp. fls2-241-R2A-168]
MNEPTGVAADAATILFNLPDYHVISTAIAAGRRQVIIETDQPPAAEAAESSHPGGRNDASNGSKTFLWPGRWRCSGPSTAGTAKRSHATGYRSSNPPRGSGAGPAPQAGSGTSSWTP